MDKSTRLHVQKFYKRDEVTILCETFDGGEHVEQIDHVLDRMFDKPINRMPDNPLTHVR
jgi:hypothetical protein